MEFHVFIMQLLIVLVFARLFGDVFSYFKIPIVIGEILAGVLIGDSLLGWVEFGPMMKIFAEIGAILLLFEVGMETDLKKLVSSSVQSTVVAISGVIFPFIFGFILSYYVFSFSLLVSLFIGSTLTATSMGIKLRVFRELKKQETPEAQVIMGAAILDDIIGIVLLSILYEFSINRDINLWNVGKVLLSIFIFFTMSPLLIKLCIDPLKKWENISKIPGFFPSIIFSLILGFYWMAHLLGAPSLLSGFIVGAGLSRQFLKKSRDFSERVEREMKPIIHLFTPIFFVGIGLSLHLHLINWGSSFIWAISGFLTLGAILGKLMSGFFLKEKSFIKRLIIGTAMVPRGEIGLIFASIGLSSGILDENIYTALVLVIVITTFAAPYALRFIYEFSKR